MPRHRRVSPDQILDAAALEFADRGFAGARVDRIARRARVNKAMLYYHFKSKQMLYRALLRRTFGLAAERIAAIGGADAPPADKIDRVIAAFSAMIRDQPFFPAIMLREVADRGAHLDPETLAVLAGVPRAFSSIVADGVSTGDFRDVNPLFTYFSTMIPIVLFLCAAPIRDELDSQQLIGSSIGSADDFVRYMQTSARRALSPDKPVSSRPRK
jgi:AcrR family transcriptional regulator